MLSRRNLLKFAVAGAAGLLLPREVEAEPEKRIWTGWSPKHDPAHFTTSMEYFSQPFDWRDPSMIALPHHAELPVRVTMGDFTVANILVSTKSMLPNKDFYFLVNNQRVPAVMEEVGNGIVRYRADIAGL